MIRRALKTLRLAFFVGLLATALISTSTSADTPVITVLRVEGTIVPVVADYIERGISQAEEDNATVCIIELDTPGGLLDATEEIVQAIMRRDGTEHHYRCRPSRSRRRARDTRGPDEKDYRVLCQVDEDYRPGARS
jgi:hypothetical protein